MNGTMPMTIETTGEAYGAESPPPTCPFCGQPWSAAMLAALDGATVHHGCACCPEPDPRARPAPVPATSHDIACDACGRALFRALPSGGAA